MQVNNKLFRDVLILILGVAGIGLFFYSFSDHHPFSTVTLSQSKDQIKVKADSVFQSWQYEPGDFIATVDFETEHTIIDSLQNKWGDEEFQKQMRESEYLQKLPLLYWLASEYQAEEDDNEPEVKVGFNTRGEVVSFSADNSLISQQRPFNRFAVRTVFQNQVDSYSRGLEDSLITGLTDYQHLNTDTESNSQAAAIVDRLRELRGAEEEEVYTMRNIWNLTDFYLKRTAWASFDLTKDSVALEDAGGFRFARAFLSTSDSVSGVTAKLTVDVLPAGTLKSLSYSLSPKIESKDGKATDILQAISLFIILVFGIWLLYVFYLRIKARAIDTKPALIIAVLAGFMVPGFWILQFLNQFGLIYGLSGGPNIFETLIGMGITGAISATGFFVITAVSDSITRQYWPEKLKTWDLIRRGLVVNKPVGWGMVHALAIGGVLAGLVTVFISVVPSTYISSSARLISDTYFLPSVANILMTTCFVLALVVPVYLIIGNQIKAVAKQKWLIPLVSALLFGLVDVLPFNIEPDIMDRGMRALVGLALGYFYMRYDFLTIVFGCFIFLNFLTTSTGWVLDGSPDANTFYSFLILLAVFSFFGVYFIVKGTEREELPEYVPDYIEDQAKEQRLKQELSIARVVQHTFLPSKFQHMPGIDMAGICIPAQETGGDYYDMIPLGEHRTALAIGDVSGKGIRAAFYMTFTKGVLHSLSALILSPVELLNQLNRLFKENATRGTFISMIYGILDAEKREFNYARAGHNPMLVVRSNGDSEWLKPDGIGIGVTNGDQFIRTMREDTLKLNEGDVVIMYTDGVTEMLNTGNHFYGEERLERLVKGVRKASSEKILEIITEDVNEFKGVAKQHDDMTLVIIKADSSVNQ